jgi:hypothetical protein
VADLDGLHKAIEGLEDARVTLAQAVARLERAAP